MTNDQRANLKTLLRTGCDHALVSDLWCASCVIDLIETVVEEAVKAAAVLQNVHIGEPTDATVATGGYHK